jgi:COP9 signalosome complex subunit 6
MNDSYEVIVLGALLGTQNGREVEIVNTFELAVEGNNHDLVDHGFLVSRRDQCTYLLFEWWVDCKRSGNSDKQVFPSLEFIGWYSVAPHPTSRHIALHEQVRPI